MPIPFHFSAYRAEPGIRPDGSGNGSLYGAGTAKNVYNCRVRRVLGGPLFLIVACAAVAAAQTPATVRGFVIHGESRTPVEGVRVSIIGTALSAFTDSSGRFSIDGIAAGTRVLQARAVGYIAGTWLLSLRDGDLLRDTFLLDPVAIAVEAVTLRPTDLDDWRSEAGFEHRRGTGRGFFVTREDIQRRQPRTVADVIRTVPGVSATCRGYGNNCVITMTRTSRGTCQPEYFLDGHQATNSTGANFPIDVAAIRGVEIYRNEFEAPVEMQRMGLRCGVIAIWTIAPGERFNTPARP